VRLAVGLDEQGAVAGVGRVVARRDEVLRAGPEEGHQRLDILCPGGVDQGLDGRLGRFEGLLLRCGRLGLSPGAADHDQDGGEGGQDEPQRRPRSVVTPG